MKILLLLSLLSLKLLASPIHQYCGDSLKKKLNHEQIIKNLDSEGLKIYKIYNKLESKSEISKWMTADEVLEFASETDILTYREEFKNYLNLIQKNIGDPDLDKLLKTEIKKNLKKKKFKAEEIKARLLSLEKNDTDRWYRVIGDRTVKEVQELFIGPELGKLTSDSLIGQYVEKSGAQTLLIKHPIAPNSKKLGPEKMIVAISEESLKEFAKVLNTDGYISTLGHAYTLHRGDVITHVGEKKAFRLPSENTPLPMLLLKTSEFYRFDRYMKASIKREFANFNFWHTPIKEPWLLEGYCAQGGYDCCTHWLGNIPIGDKRVHEYKFPGRFENKQPPQVQTLKPYKTDDEEIKQIWKYPGHEQLASVIGEEKSNLDGQFASPGWVIHSLLGPTDNQRVPIIFLVTKDHKKKIPKDIYKDFYYEEPR